MDLLLFLTGRPGVGKTSVLIRALSALKAKGYDVGGMISREFREEGVRSGFEILDLKTGRKGWLAHVNQPRGPRVGKYRVNLNDLNAIGVGSILKAVKESEIIIIDEIGPMELFSTAFKKAVRSATGSDKPLIGTVHYRALDRLTDIIRVRKVEIIEVTQENREFLHTVVVDKVLQFFDKD